MTIEEAIQHYNETAKETRQAALEFARINVYDSARNCQECAAKHEQLAEWLTELKQRREAEITAPPKTNGDLIRQMTDKELADKLTDKCAVCAYHYAECETTFCLCVEGVSKWLKQEVSEDAGTD